MGKKSVESHDITQGVPAYRYKYTCATYLNGLPHA